MALRNLLVRVGADISGLSQGMKNANKQIENFGNRLNSALGGVQGKLTGALAGLGAGMYLKDAMSDAIKYEALMGTLSQTMGESIHGFIKWQDTVGASMGFSKLQGAELANMLSLNFKAIATDTEDLMNKTTAMMELAAVISNKRGMAMTEVSDRIRSAMNQEADGAMELGVDVRIAAIQTSKAYKEMANGAPWDSLSEGMRKNILYHHIFEQVTKNLGNTLQANTQIKMVQFTSALRDVRLALGQAFLPILNIVLPVLTAFMRRIQQALQWVSAFSRALFGRGKMKTIGNEKAMGSATSAIQDQGVALGNMGSSAGKSAKGVDKASKAVKELANNLQGFDEVNTIEEPKDPSAGADGGGGVGGGGGGVGGGGGIGIPDDAFLPLQEGDSWIEEITDSAEKMADKFREFFESNGWQTMKEGLHDFWDSLTDLAESPAIQKLKKAFVEDLPNFFSDIAQIGGGTFKVLGGAVDIFNGIINTDFAKGMEGAGDMVSGLWDITSATIGLVLPDLGNAMDKFGDEFGKKWKWFQDSFVEGSDNIKEVGGKLGIFISVWLALKFQEMKEKAMAKIVELALKWEQIFQDIKLFIKLAMEVIRAHIEMKAEEAKEDFLKPFRKVAKWFEDNVSKPIKKSFENINAGFDKGIAQGFKAIYNEAVGKINMMIGSINSLDIGGWSPSIPKLGYLRLAKGGITNGPTMAMIGDNPGGREVVSPLDQLQGYVTNAVIQAMNINGGGNTQGDVILNIDGRQFARLVKPFLDKESNRLGTSVKLSTL